MKRIAIAASLLLALSCGLPRDPDNTLEHVRGRVLHAGVSIAPPFIVRRGDEATGIEADLLRRFATSLGAKIVWSWDAQEKQLAELHENELDIVAGGLTGDSPWKSKVALTRPYADTRDGKRHVFAVPPGENAFLLQLETFLATHHEQAEDAARSQE